MQSNYSKGGEMSSEKKTKVNLKAVAERVGLAPCSISAVLNGTPASRTIPQATKERIFRAAAELNYRPNLWARSLRTKRTRMIGVVTPDFGRAAVAKVVAAVQERLHRRGYLLVLTTVDSTTANHATQFQQRGIEGLIAIDSQFSHEMDLPIAAVDLSYLAPDSLTDGISHWLSELGTSAAEEIIRQIENETSGQRVVVEPELSPSYFDLTSASVSPRREIA